MNNLHDKCENHIVYCISSFRQALVIRSVSMGLSKYVIRFAYVGS